MEDQGESYLILTDKCCKTFFRFPKSGKILPKSASLERRSAKNTAKSIFNVGSSDKWPTIKTCIPQYLPIKNPYSRFVYRRFYDLFLFCVWWKYGLGIQKFPLSSLISCVCGVSREIIEDCTLPLDLFRMMLFLHITKC